LGNTSKSFTFETNLNAYFLKNNFIILIILLSITISFSSCDAVKYVPENENLLIKNTVIVDGKKNVDSEITDYIVQRPNQLVLGIPLQLYFYNLGNKYYETDFEEWKLSHPQKHKFWSDIFSEKQVRGFRHFKYQTNEWFLNSGEAPVILDNGKTEQTILNLTQHYLNEGYFKAQVTSETKLLKNKKSSETYIVTTNKPYTIDSISTNIASPVLDSIYKESKFASNIKKGDHFKLSAFIDEQQRLTTLFRNTGVYRFTKNAITFEADSANYKANVELLISDSIANVPFRIQKIKKINIYTDYSFQNKDAPIKDTLNYNGYTFLAQDKIEYKPKHLLNAVFIEPNSLYKDDARELTRKNLRNLQNFRSVEIKYTELENDSLEANIYLTPLKKYSLGFNTELTHSNARPFGTLAKVSFSNRNIFGGAEILKFSIQGSFIDSKDAAEQESFFNAWEIGADVSLEIPRFLLPFNEAKIISKERAPQTNFSLGTSLQKNIGLDKQRFTGIIDYVWEGSKKINNSLQILNAQFIKNLNPDQYFYIYSYEYEEIKAIQIAYFPDYPLTENNVIDFIDENMTPEFELTNPDAYELAINIESRYYIITTNDVIPSIAYTFTYSNRENYKDNNYSFFRARIASAGAITTAISTQKDSSNVKTIFNTPIAQYIRTDFEYKKFWELKEENVLAFRTFIGVAIPYGNSEAVPFSRSYFIGGPNDLRAWQIYTLGPGSAYTGLEYNVGNLKFLNSLEYRFEILNSLKGAFFVDAGNIWDITDSSLTPPEAKFTGFESLKATAIGSGFGVRYDLSFVLVRLDLGFKTYEPYIKQGSKWFQHYNFANVVYNFGISYPF
jgi:outer membrane protein assembly factor BamA